MIASANFATLIGICTFFGVFLVGGSVLVMSIKMIGRTARFLFGPPSTVRQNLPRVPRDRCPQPRCGELNPAGARFCKRCGGRIQGQTFAGRSGDIDVRG